MPVGHKIEDQMGHDSKPNRPAKYRATKTVLDDQPGGKGSDEGRADGV